jgi:HEAT repeat protein
VFAPPSGDGESGPVTTSPSAALVARLSTWPRADAKEAARLLAAAWSTSRDAVREALRRRPIDGPMAAGAAWVVGEAGDADFAADLAAVLEEKTVASHSAEIWAALARIDTVRSRGALVERLTRWPDADARDAARLLVSTWDESKEHVRLALRRRPLDARIASGAAWVVAEVGEVSMAGDLEAALRERTLYSRPNEVIESLVRLEPSRARERLLALLSIPSTQIVVAAADAVQPLLTKADVPVLLALAESKTPTVRRTVLGLAAELDLDETWPVLERSLGDSSGEVAAAAAMNMGFRADAARLEALNARARGPESRRAAFALLALVRAGEKSGNCPIDASTTAAILGTGGLRSSDRTLRLMAAIALADLVQMRADPNVDAILEQEIVPVLIDAVAGLGFFSDLAVLRPVAMDRLRLVSEGTGSLQTAPQWAEWWGRTKVGFKARRALVTLPAATRTKATVTISGREVGAAGAGVFTSDLSQVPVDGGAGGRFLLLDAEEMDRIGAALDASGFFGAPEASAAPPETPPALEIVVAADGRSRRARWMRADAVPAEMAGLIATLAAVREGNHWQALWDRRVAPTFPTFVEEQRTFWRTAVPVDRAERRVSLAVGASRDLASDDDRRALLLEMVTYTGLGEHLRPEDASVIASFAAVGETLSPTGEAALRVLSAAGSTAGLAPLRLRLATGREPARIEALLGEALAAAPTAAVRSAALDGDSPEIRRAALGALARSGATDAGEVIRACLASPDASVRGAALHALGMLRDPEAGLLLRGALETETEPAAREGAVAGLGALGGPDVLPLLAGVLRSPDARYRVAAVRALTATGEPEALSLVLASMPGESDAVVRGAADDALRTVGGERAREALRSVALDARRDGESRARAVEGLGVLGVAASAADLRGLLGDRDPAVADAAAFVLGWVRDEIAASRLVDALASGRSPARATRCLEVLSLESFRETRDREEAARYYTGWLQVQGARGARGWLVDALAARGHADEGMAAWDSGGDGVTAVPTFLKAFDDAPWYLRRAIDLELRRLSGQEFGEVDAWTSPEAAERILASWKQWWQRGR